MLYIYGYLNRVQSSRRLEREAGRNVEVMWLLGRLAPDHKTIADFRKDNGLALRSVRARRSTVSIFAITFDNGSADPRFHPTRPSGRRASSVDGEPERGEAAYIKLTTLN